MLIEELEKGHLLLMNGHIVISADEPLPLTYDHHAWMALDEEDFAALKALAEDKGETR